MSGSDGSAVLDHRVSDDYDMHSPPRHSEDEAMEDIPGMLNPCSGIGKLTLYIYIGFSEGSRANTPIFGSLADVLHRSAPGELLSVPAHIHNEY
jgi:hypothetical protein